MTCDAYYGTGFPHPNGAAVCRRPKGHPPVSEDGVGHSPWPIRGDEPVEVNDESR